MSIKVNNENFNFLLNLEPSMFDEKMDKARLSMKGTGSNWTCILCFGTRFSARKNVGTFECCRTIESIMECAKERLENPSNLSEKDLKAATKGVKCVPLMKEVRSCFEALHADLSWMRFVIGIVLRVKANIKQWRESKEVKETIRVVRNEFDDFVRQNIGLQPQLQLPGNYVREILSDKIVCLLHVSHFLGSIEGSKAPKDILQQYNWLRRVYRAKNPDPVDVSVYKKKAVALAKLLLKEFPWALWPNYFHWVVEHVQELIEKHGSVGALSAEDVEAGNKQVRLFRTLYSRT